MDLGKVLGGFWPILGDFELSEVDLGKLEAVFGWIWTRFG